MGMRKKQFIEISWPCRAKINLYWIIQSKNIILTGKEQFIKGVRLFGYGQEVLRNGAEYLSENAWKVNRRKLHSGTSKTKELVPVQLDVSLFWKPHRVTCVPA